jgi:hypothetical protein
MPAELKLVPPVEATPHRKRARTEPQKAARREADKAFRSKHREQVLAQQRANALRWSKKHPDKKREKNKLWAEKKRSADPRYFADNRARFRVRNADKLAEIARRERLQQYGLTLAEYESMVVYQNGVCAICRRPESEVLKGNIKRLAVDHDHEDGHVRGLLCSSCNNMLGRSGDSPERLRSAADYLEKAK